MGIHSIFNFNKRGHKYKNLLTVYDNNFEHFMEFHPDAVVQLDIDGRIICVNEALTTMFGYQKNDLLLKRIENFYEQSKHNRLDYFRLAVKGETQIHHAVVNDIHSTPLQVEITYIPILSSKMKVESIVMIIKDISTYMNYKDEALLMQHKVEFLENHDILTELPNRLAFEHKVEVLINSNQAFSLLLFKLERLSFINESLGQSIGDKYIREVSNKIHFLLENESCFARVSGDEFAIVIWGYQDNQYPERLADNILQCMDKPIVINSYDIYSTLNIGISKFGEKYNTIDKVFYNAEKAFCASKERGKNTYFVYDSTPNNINDNKITLEHDLRNSIEKQELVLHFQPRVSSHNGKIVAAEALIRWNHPERGLLSPDNFIPLAEEIGFINEIGDWVLEEICGLIARLKDNKVQLVPISINISAQRFLKKDFITTINTIIDKHQIDSSLIEFEITEATLIKHEKVVKEVIDEIRELGIRIALDDFGTGYSSLTYINQFPIDTIKIDRSFINQVTESEESAVIIKSLIYLAKELKMNLVAEGVETYDQLSFLKQQECQEIQGYIFSKPVPEENFYGLLRRKMLSPVSSQKESMLEDRRNYFRIILPFPLSSRMSIAAIGGKSVEIGSSEVLIEDLGPGGLRFLSSLNLPVRPDIVCNFEVVIMGKMYSLNGKISWKEETNELYRYGIQFYIEEVERDKLIGDLNHFSLLLRNNPFVPECNFVEDDRYSYLKKLEFYGAKK